MINSSFRTRGKRKRGSGNFWRDNDWECFWIDEMLNI